jgi:hypothetical protein
MKRILSLFAIIPFITFAQSPKTNSKKPPLIESITSDTSNGKFNQVLFSYDKRNRVIAIVNKEIKITTDSKKTNQLVEKVIKEQIFEYKDTASQPLSRKTIAVQYDKIDEFGNKIFFLESIEQQYFLYENGQRAGDSATLLKNWRKEVDWDWKKAEPEKRIGKFSQTNERIYHEIYISKPYGNPNIYSNEFLLGSQLNISNDASSYRWANRANNASYYTYSSFDAMRNPLKDLNIASTLVNEKVSSEFGGQYGKTDINWYFLNENNYIDYIVSTDEQTTPFKYIFKFNYTYNQFEQPLYAKAQVKQVYKYNSELVREYQQRFTFRYKK